MSELLVIDIGNSVFKISYKDEMMEFNSKIKKIDINTMDFAESIIYEDECFAISQGDYVHDTFKANKEGLEQFILYAISTMIKDKEVLDVNLMLNLPVNQLINKEILKSRLQNTYQFTVNSPKNSLNKYARIVSIHKIGVVAESIACYYSLEDVTPFITILDIGSKTINYATFTEIGVNDIAKSNTLEFGIHDLYKDVIEYYKQENKTYSIADIDSRIRANKIKIPKDIKENFIAKIKNGLLANGFLDFDDYSLRCCGGGSLVLGKELESGFSDVTILDNSVYRNIIGSKLIAESLGF